MQRHPPHNAKQFLCWNLIGFVCPKKPGGGLKNLLLLYRLDKSPRLPSACLLAPPSYNNNIYLGGGNESPSTGENNWGNVAVGLGSMNANSTGNANTALGFNSLANNLSGYGNMAVGIQALQTNISGNYNVGIGHNSGSGIKANSNVSIGLNTLWKDNNGNENVAIGGLALANLLNTSSDNTSIGYKAGFDFNNGNNNIFIGANTSPSSTNVSNELNIGNWIYGSNGKIAIGGRSNFSCSDCLAYNLFVKDGIRTEKVKVDVATAAGWADYVFAKDYKLMPLQEVKNYIDQNQHLPEVPSAEEVVANGVELKEMTTLLLKKIEELTLYTIEQQNQIDELKKLFTNPKK